MAKYESQFSGAAIDERLGKIPGLVTDVEDLKENGVGTPGEDGGYYIPNIDAGGNLTFTASKPSMPSVAGVNLTGPKGADGTSVYIVSQSISTEPGGVSTITFSDGTVISIRNGNDGQDLTDGAYMPSENPTGTGALSVNRLAGSAVGEKSVAVGYDCAATNQGSSAEGVSTKVYSVGGHGEGFASVIEEAAMGAHAEGVGTIANEIGQHVEGKYNVKDTAKKYLHILGNGTSASERKNAHTVDKDGNAWFRGDLFIGGEGQESGTNIKDLIPAAGKSAYEYAVEGGYKGTEEEFAAKLAMEEDWYATVKWGKYSVMSGITDNLGNDIPITMEDLDGAVYADVYLDGNWYNNIVIEYSQSNTFGKIASIGVVDAFVINIFEQDGITYRSLEVFGTDVKDSYYIEVDVYKPEYNKMPAGFLPEEVETVLNKPEPWLKITITGSGTSYAADKTFDEIVAAISAGSMPYLYFDDNDGTSAVYVLNFERQINLSGNPYRLIFALSNSGWGQGYVNGYIQIDSDDKVTFNLKTV